MPLVLVFLYIAIEAVAFYAVATWLGIGWALLALFALMVVGGLAGMSQVRRVSARAAQGRIGPGQLAGDIGLLFAGTILAASPGFITAIPGFFLIIPFTRSLVRKSAANSLTRRVQDFGARAYSASPMAQRHTSYGSFVIDEDPRA
ncbi:FxsA family protein [Corynebacterium tapiri]|nr:FxsA family protein [Corynebacterium tapiri]